jgi:hypothetical protein
MYPVHTERGQDSFSQLNCYRNNSYLPPKLCLGGLRGHRFGGLMGASFREIKGGIEIQKTPDKSSGVFQFSKYC